MYDCSLEHRFRKPQKMILEKYIRTWLQDTFFARIYFARIYPKGNRELPAFKSIYHLNLKTE